MRDSRLKRVLREGKVAAGCGLRIPSVEVVEIMAVTTDFDWVMIDTEHGAMSLESAQNLARAADLAGITPLIRVHENSSNAITRALDAGAGGVVVPHVDSKEAAEMAVKHAKFAPMGERDFCPYVRAGDHFMPPEEVPVYMTQANEETSVDIILESTKAIDNFEEIISVAGIDTVHLGPGDLSQSLGVPGEFEHPLVLDKLHELIAIATNQGVTVCLPRIVAYDPPRLKHWTEVGVRNFLMASANSWVYQAFHSKWQGFEESLGPDWRSVLSATAVKAQSG